MSRDIRRRSFFTGLASSDLIQEYIASLTALSVMPVSDSMTGTIIYVESEKAIFAYHSTATDTANGTTIIEPATGVGRWFLISSSGTASSSPYTADRWVDPTHATVSESIVVLDEFECRRGNLIIDSSLTVDPGGSVYVTDGFAEERRHDFFQTNTLPTDTYRSIPFADHLVMHTTADRPFVIDGQLEVLGELVCIDFKEVPQEQGIMPSGTVGQILYIPEGTNFIACTPVVSSDGYILTNNDGHILVEGS